MFDEKIMGEDKVLLDQAQQHLNLVSGSTVSDDIALLHGFRATLFDFETNLETSAADFVDRRLAVGAATMDDLHLLKARATAKKLQHAEWSIEASQQAPPS